MKKVFLFLVLGIFLMSFSNTFSTKNFGYQQPKSADLNVLSVEMKKTSPPYPNPNPKYITVRCDNCKENAFYHAYEIKSPLQHCEVCGAK